MAPHSKYPLAIHIFFIKNDCVLLLRRYNTGYEDGQYSVVAGHVEYNESILAAAKREICEEVGVNVCIEDIHICGCMHRKSDDERIDYFAYINKWSGDIYNAEPNKCDDLMWVDFNHLPSITIPYINRAIELTVLNDFKGIWYEEFGWNTNQFLEQEQVDDILNSRGLGKDLNDFNSNIKVALNKLNEVDDNFANKGSVSWIKHINFFVSNSFLIIGTPIIHNIIADKKKLLSACSVIPLPVHDGKIDYCLFKEQLFGHLKLGIGVGVDLSTTLYPHKELTKIDSLLNELEEDVRLVTKRPIALMVTLSDKHPCLKDFIECRKNKNWDKTKLNTSIFISSNQTLNENVDAISRAIYTSGEPGLLFSDRINRDNSTPQWEYICTAPCAEVAMSSQDACHFSYLNISRFVKSKNQDFDFDLFDECIHHTVRFLDDVVEFSLLSDENEKSLIREKRRIGIGIMGFATALILMGIKYDSLEGLAFAKKICEHMQYVSKTASCELSKERGPFPAFSRSKYNDISWIDRKFSFEYFRKSNIDALKTGILEFGLRNATTVAFPPTGISSRICSVSQSFEPYLHFYNEFMNHKYVPAVLSDYIYTKYGYESDELIAQLLRDEVDSSRFPEFVTIRDISVNWQIQYTKIFQSLSDGSASKTVILNENVSTDTIKEILIQSNGNELKGISIFKLGSDKKNSADEC